jgi:hypothetical protein
MKDYNINEICETNWILCYFFSKLLYVQLSICSVCSFLLYYFLYRWDWILCYFFLETFVCAIVHLFRLFIFVVLFFISLGLLSCPSMNFINIFICWASTYYLNNSVKLIDIRFCARTIPPRSADGETLVHLMHGLLCVYSPSWIL